MPFLRPSLFLATILLTLNATAAEGILFVTHSSRYWDKDKRFRAAIENVVGQAREAHFRVVNNEDLASEDTLTTYGDNSPVSHPLPDDWHVGGITEGERNQSNWGDHEIADQAHVIIATGGNLSACLCRTIRDALTYSVDHGKTPTLIVATEAVYEGPRRLSEMMSQMDDAAFLRHLSILFLNPATGGLCKVDRIGPDFHLEIRREGRALATYGAENAPAAIIDFRAGNHVL